MKGSNCIKCANCKTEVVWRQKGNGNYAEYLRRVAEGLKCANCGEYKKSQITKETAEKYKLQPSKYVYLI